MQYLLIGIPIVIVLLVIVIAMQPAAFTVKRSATLSAPPGALFGLINDFHRWVEWSPWEALDPAMKKTYDGPPSGVGAHYHWIGNRKVGEGKITITESRPSDLIRLKLEFLVPFKATNQTEFTFKPEGSQTVVTWTMTGTRNFVMKGFGLIGNMDKMIGGDFEKGLTKLGIAAQSPARA